MKKMILTLAFVAIPFAALAADEVTLEFYSSYDYIMNTHTVPTDTQTYDIGTAVAIPDYARLVRVNSNSAAFWIKFGGSDVSAVSYTSGGNLRIPAEGARDFIVGPSSGLYIDTAGDS